MTNAKSESTQVAVAADLDAIDNLGTVVKAASESLIGGDEFSRPVRMARAMRAIEEAMTDEVMQDLMYLMNSPLGYKTDRTGKADRNGVQQPFYTVDVVRKVMIQGFLVGARATGNEINIYAGQLYLTKEYFTRMIRDFPGAKNFRHYIGPAAKHGARTAIMEATANWVDSNGNEQAVEFVDKRQDAEPGRDMRIVVNAYETSGPDQLRGLGESKLFRRAYVMMTGIEHLPGDPTNTVDGQVIEPAGIEQKNDDEPVDSDTIKKLVAGFANIGVSEDAIAVAAGCPVNDIKKSHYDALRKDYALIDSGKESRIDLFNNDAFGIRFDALQAIENATDTATVTDQVGIAEQAFETLELPAKRKKELLTEINKASKAKHEELTKK